VETILSC